MTDKTGGPAFPQDYEHTKVLVQMQQVGDISVDQFQKLSRQLAGMTLRDYFAAKAMSSYLDRPNLPINVSDEQLAFASYDMADAMLKAREQ